MKKLVNIVLSLVLVLAVVSAGKGVLFQHCLCSDSYSLVTHDDCTSSKSDCMETVLEQLDDATSASPVVFSFHNPFSLVASAFPLCGWTAEQVRFVSLVTSWAACVFSPPPRLWLNKICVLLI